MIDADMIFSLGPSCRNTVNLRRHFHITRAYPFDWWITPTKSMLAMIEPGFQFNASASDLQVFEQLGSTVNTVYNSRLNLCHHHDFARTGENGVNVTVTKGDIDNLNIKYHYLFSRLREDLAQARHPVAILNGLFGGWIDQLPNGGYNSRLNGPVEISDAIRYIRSCLGSNVFVLIIEIGEPARSDYEGGLLIQLPDNGARTNLPPSLDYAEPVHVFEAAYSLAGIKAAIALSVPDDNGLFVSSDSPEHTLATYIGSTA